MNDPVTHEGAPELEPMGSEPWATDGALTFFQVCGRAIMSPSWGLSTVSGCITRWYWSRSPLAFCLGVPALVIFVLFCGLVAMAEQDRNATLAVSYRERALDAFSAEDWERAEFFFRKAIVLDDFDDVAWYGLAELAEQAGDVAKTRVLMQRLAPNNGLGDPRAHFWVAKDIAASQSKPLSKRAQREIIHHLTQTVDRLDEPDEALRSLAELHLARQELRLAVGYLERLAKSDPGLLANVGNLYLHLGQRPLADEFFRQARRHYQVALAADKGNSFYSLKWAEAEHALGDYGEAKQILLKALQEPDIALEDQAKLEQTLVGVFVASYDATRGTDSNDSKLVLEELQTALVLVPNDPKILLCLADFAVQGNPESAVAKAELHRVIAAGKAPTEVHVLLGDAALKDEDHTVAIRHFEIVFQAFPESAEAANNLAWALSHAPNPDLARAEKLIADAHRKQPRHPEIRATRGYIFVQLGRKKEAVKELEFALRTFPNRTGLHASLAALYEELGDPDLAALHRKLAQPPR
jgi:tetratricopeptide (TPR) repeat protein